MKKVLLEMAVMWHERPWILVMTGFVVVMGIWLLTIVNKELPKEGKHKVIKIENKEDLSAGDIFDDKE